LKSNKWPKILPPLTPEQEKISHDFMKRWLGLISDRFHYEFFNTYFNHGYVIKHAPMDFLTTLDIGAGIGEHLKHEKLISEQKSHYVALDIRKELITKIEETFPGIKTHLGDCQEPLPFDDGYFDRILAIHVLEHLPNLPAALREIHRLCCKKRGVFSVVIPCEGGGLYGLIRKMTAKRLFEKTYAQPYKWLIEREHINMPDEIFEELGHYFDIKHCQYFPLGIRSIHCNLFIGLTLTPSTA